MFLQGGENSTWGLSDACQADDEFFRCIAASYADQLMDALPDVQFFVKDAQGRYRKVNQTLKDNYLIANVEEIIGKTDHELFPQYLADGWVKDDQHVLQGNVIQNRIELVGRYDGSASWSITNKIPVRLRTGEVCGLAGITRDLGQARSTVAAYHELLATTTYIEEHYGEPIDVETLAHKSHMSVRTLQRRFREIYRMTPMEFVRRVRINKASHLLATSDQPINSVALEVGFSDQSHLTRELVKYTGYSPKTFRKRYQNTGP